MKQRRIGGWLAIAAVCCQMQADADPISTPVGYIKATTVNTNSDALISVPFHEATEFEGAVVGAPVGNTITANNTISFPVNGYTNQYFVRFTSGAKEGLWSTVIANGANTLTLEDAALVAGVMSGDTFVLQPHQTLNSLFPASLQGTSFIQSPSASIRRTEVLALNLNGIGINKSSVASYYYINQAGTNVGWRLVAASPAQLVDVGHTVIPPGSYMILRNKGVTNTLVCLPAGTVEFGKVGRTLITRSVQNDYYVSSERPVDLTLNQLGLGGTAAFQSSPSPSIRRDTILMFDNDATGQNKSASATYYYINQAGTNVGWRLVAPAPASLVDVGDDILVKAGQGFILRKATGTASTNDWTVAAPYNNE
jgi:uncharacterized protein (TIGR02597 family)